MYSNFTNFIAYSYIVRDDHIKRQYFFHWKIEYNWKCWVCENNEGTTHQLKASKFFATTLRHNWLKATTMKKIQRVLSKEFHWLLIEQHESACCKYSFKWQYISKSTINFIIFIVIITYIYLSMQTPTKVHVLVFKMRSFKYQIRQCINHHNF